MMNLTQLYKFAIEQNEFYKLFLNGNHPDAEEIKALRDDAANEYKERGGKRKFAWEN